MRSDDRPGNGKAAGPADPRRKAGRAGRTAPPLRREAAGDPDTLVAVDSPDDVDLYRHSAPPPGFGRAGLRPPDRPEDKRDQDNRD